MKNTFQHFGIIGAGAWGTALAVTLQRAGRDVTLWSHSQECADNINMRHENTQHLVGINLDPAIKATHDLSAFGKVDVLLFAMPAQRLREIAQNLTATKTLNKNIPIVITAKGIELGTTKLMGDVVAEEMPEHGMAIISGPSFAREVAEAKPTALTLATKDAALGEGLMQAMATPTFRPYLSDDIIGAQLGGAVKNVLAIASGIVTGKKFGDNTRAALITRGLAELMRLGTALGAKPETLMGLSGLGDLMLTCSSPQSRNMSLGIALGQGQALDVVLASRNSVAEGVPTAAAALELAALHSVEMPIVAAMAAVLTDAVSVDQAILDLLARPLKLETK